MKKIILLVSLPLILFPLAYADTSRETLDILLGSGSVSEQRAAFEKIASSPEKYLPLIRERLASFADGRIDVPGRSIDRLFYLSAFLKDTSLIPPIEAIWKDTDLLPHYCLYSCPIVFALTIYATSGMWTPPENMKKEILRHYDLYPEIRRASDISLDPTPEGYRVRGPGIDIWLRKAAAMSERELIEQAGQDTQEPKMREAATFQLSYTVSSSENLKDLYWLAIQEHPPDGASEGRGAIYKAIYRAEKAQRMGR
jgi:hypothetical protein